VALYNADGENGAKPHYAKDFTVSISETGSDSSSFRDVVSGALQPRAGAQEFRFPRTRARYVRLLIRNGYGAAADPVELAEFEAYATDGSNVLLSHSAKRITDGPRLLRFSSELGQLNNWSANNINDGRKSGARGSWSSAGPPPLAVRDSAKIVDLTALVDRNGRLRWKAPPGKWTILRYICTNTGEHLKVPSPNSDGLATDHLSAAATERCMRYVVDRLHTALPNFNDSALKNLYLASYEVQGQIWTPDFLDQFRARRGYDLKPFLPVLRGGLVDNDQVTDRVRYDFDKTLGEMLVDNYYRAAGKVARDAGLLIESEAGGPGPPIHRVPVDALQALGAVDVVRGEFWPYRPEAKSMWVIKETASAAHIYGKPVVHMESFTSNYHWQEGPAFLKDAADRAFCEGMNHVVWHTSSHQPPEAGKPGWVYGAGTHMSQNRPWWPMMKPFLEYLGRASFLLQQGRFVADVLYYYGDQGYNFVMPKHVDPSLGPGYDYDVTNEDALIHRLEVRDGKLVLPDGMRYEVLVLPERDDIDLPVLRRIEELVHNGATVVGSRPRRSTGFYDYAQRDAEVSALAEKLWGRCDGKTVLSHVYGKGKIVCGKPLRDVLHERGIGPDFTYQSPNSGVELDYIHRSTPEAEIYFVRNKKPNWEQVRATFRISGRQPEIWSPDSGEMRPDPMYTASANGTTVPLLFAPQGSFFVVFRKHPAQPGILSVTRDGRALDHTRPFPALDWTSGMAFESGVYQVRLANGAQKQVRIGELPAASEITGPWAVRFPEGMGAPPAAQFPKLISWTESADPGIRYFSGIAEYTAGFSFDEHWLGRNRRIYLDLGELWAAADVKVNGQPAGIVWKPPYRADITAAVHAGSNQLTVRVANDWANRLIGDARDPNGKHYTRTNIVRTTSEGLPWDSVNPIRSGLFGPVFLHAGEVFWK
jgi:alpha-L-rhamnosidase